MAKLRTTLGDLIDESELEAQERVECPICHFAVIEDEYISCEECDGEDGCCLYCLQEGRHIHKEDSDDQN